MSDKNTAPLSLIGVGQIFPDAEQAEKIHNYATDYRIQMSEALHKRACKAHQSSTQSGWYGLGNSVACLALGTAYRVVKAVSPSPPTTTAGNPW